MKIISSDFRIIVQNIGWLTVERFFRLGLTLIVGILVARYLGPEGFGKLSYVLTFAIVIEAISTLGLDNIIVKNVVESPTEESQSISTAFMLRLSSSLFLIPLAILLLYLLRDDPEVMALGYFMLSSAVFRSFDVIDFWFQSKIWSKYVVWSKMISFTTYAGLRLGVIFLDLGILSLGYAFVAESVIRSIALMFFYRKKQSRINILDFDSAIAKKMLIRSWPLLLSAITVMVYMKIDIVMLGSMTSDDHTGIYTSAVRLSEIFYNIPVIVSATLFPVLLALKKRNNALYEARLKLLYGVLVPLMLLVGIAITLTAQPLVNLLYGQAFSNSADVLVIHIWSGIFITFSVLRGKWLIIEGLERYTILAQGLGAITNVGLNIVLIPKFGPIGAAYATLISYFTATTLISGLVPKLRYEFWLQIKSAYFFILVPKYFNDRIR